MSEQIDGGPAFPIPSIGTGDPRDGMTTGSQGMTMRDYFAAKAMQGMLANFVVRFDAEHAEKCYQVADAMIEARNQ